MPPGLVVGLLALPFVPLVARSATRPDSTDWLWQAALGGLVLSGLLRAALPVGPPRPAVVRGAHVAVAALWASFYVADLHTTRFAWVLLLVPVGAVLGASAGRRHAALGAIVALTAVWALMVRRADNGCTGVSGTFGAVLLLHPVLALWPAPFLARAPVSRPERAVHDS